MTALRKGGVLLLALVCAACASAQGSGRPAALYWFTKPEPVMVSEVWRSTECQSPNNEMSVALLGSRAALERWAAERSLVLSIAGGGQIADTAVAVISLGKRPGPGWGLAVSQEAAVRGGTLEVKATFFEPPPQPGAKDVTDYCSIIELPSRYEITGVRVTDQYDKLRVWTRLPKS